VKQLAMKGDAPRSETIFNMLSSFYLNWKRSSPSIQALTYLVVRICSALHNPYLVIDGMDEAENDTRKSLSTLIQELRNISVPFLVTARPHIFLLPEFTRTRASRLVVKARHDDIVTFIKAKIHQSENLQILVGGNERLQAILVQKIHIKAAGQ
jgi:hypothetical protein